MLEPVTLRADYGGRRERRRRGLKDKKKGTEESETREGERQSKEEPGTKLGDPGVSSSGWAVPGLDQMPTKHPKSLLAHFRAISADAAARSMVASKPSIEKAGMGPDPATEEGAPWESTKSDKDDRVVVHRCWGGENFVHPSFIRNVPLPQRGSLAVAALKVCKPTANSRTALRPASSQRSWLPEPWNETSTTTVLAGVVSPLGPPSPPTAYTSQRTTSVVRVVSLGGCR